MRAALDLVAAVAALGEEVGRADLRLRAGVLTGEAAVNLGADGPGDGRRRHGQHRVAGSSRAAEPGTVLVGEATRRATEAAVAYEDAGDASS